jgi:hypothetical protein
LDDLVLGVHVGLSHPGGQPGAGSAATTPNMSDLAPTSLPVGLDVGWALTPAVYAGATVEWGPTMEQQRGACFSCSAGSLFHAEGELRFFLLPHQFATPWLSLGAGWEAIHESYGSGLGSANYDGPVLADVRLGVDFRDNRLAVGPYFGVAFAEFIDRSLEPSPAGLSSDIDARSVHEWFTLGVRGAFRPF